MLVFEYSSVNCTSCCQLHLQSAMDEVECNEFFAEKSDGFREIHALWQMIQHSGDLHCIEVPMHA